MAHVRDLLPGRSRLFTVAFRHDDLVIDGRRSVADIVAIARQQATREDLCFILRRDFEYLAIYSENETIDRIIRNPAYHTSLGISQLALATAIALVAMARWLDTLYGTEVILVARRARTNEVIVVINAMITRINLTRAPADVLLLLQQIPAYRQYRDFALELIPSARQGPENFYLTGSLLPNIPDTNKREVSIQLVEDPLTTRLVAAHSKLETARQEGITQESSQDRREHQLNEIDMFLQPFIQHIPDAAAPPPNTLEERLAAQINDAALVALIINPAAAPFYVVV